VFRVFVYPGISPVALKDLVAQSSALAEDAIEKIVKDYVRYDPEAREIAFTPAFAALGNKAKVLVYLVALQGWGFVTEEPVATPTKPADMGDKLGIAGGSLRPILKDLKDRHLVTSKGSEYSVRAPSLPSVERELEAGSGAGPARISHKPKKRTAAKPSRKAQSAEGAEAQVEKADRKRRRGGGLKNTFEGWIAEGFFAEPRTLADVQARFHEEAMLIPRTSIPGYLLGAVRAKSLSRRKQDVNGKTVWVYQSK
jgi:hypothetical protein